MNVTPNEAEEALASIQKVTQKTRQSIAASGAYITLIVTGIVWMVGYTCTQFLPGPLVVYIWAGISLLGSILAVVLGTRAGRRVRGPATASYAKRIGIFWLLLIGYGAAAIAVTRPANGLQLTMLIILFVLVGQMSMGLLFSFAATWWVLPITILALAGYYSFPGIFYLWMGLLVGGTMIALGLYIHARW
jgi:hypothetical protein